MKEEEVQLELQAGSCRRCRKRATDSDICFPVTRALHLSAFNYRPKCGKAGFFEREDPRVKTQTNGESPPEVSRQPVTQYHSYKDKEAKGKNVKSLIFEKLGLLISAPDRSRGRVIEGADSDPE